jgi:2-C-methyl-D-erythritol 4-phosphate cytidylyltransferase
VNGKDLEAVQRQWGAELASLGVSPIVVGGAERQESVRAGVEALDRSCEWVAIHDAVRPFVSSEAVQAVIRSAREHGAAILASPMKETVKESSDGRLISQTVPRASLWCAQTPQVFSRAQYLELSKRAIREGWQVTDDAQVLEMAGLRVAIVEGTYDNIKITTEADWRLAQALMAARLTA